MNQEKEKNNDSNIENFISLIIIKSNSKQLHQLPNVSNKTITERVNEFILHQLPNIFEKIDLYDGCSCSGIGFNISFLGLLSLPKNEKLPSCRSSDPSDWRDVVSVSVLPPIFLVTVVVSLPSPSRTVRRSSTWNAYKSGQMTMLKPENTKWRRKYHCNTTGLQFDWFGFSSFTTCKEQHIFSFGRI